MNIELNKYFLPEKEKKSKVDISLSGMLEVYIGHYFVSGEGGGAKNYWLTIYYDSDIDAYDEAVETVPSNIVAYVSSDYKWAFVLNEHSHKLRKDVSNYGISCISVPDFESEVLQCLHPDWLPYEFSGLLWIDDDFMDDENIPFDFDSFAIIDDGVCYLNPKHFSVAQFIKVMESIRS